MQISVSSNVTAFKRHLNDMQRNQLPFATALALTRTAQDAKASVDASLDHVFDKPTPFTKRGTAILSANKQTLTATVLFKPIQAGYLRLEEAGGSRLPKRRAVVVPVGIKKNQYGSMTRNALKRALAQKNVFSGKIKGQPGIWQRMRNGKVRLLIAYLDRTMYEPRLRFKETVEKVVRRRFEQHLAKAMLHAINNPRR